MLSRKSFSVLLFPVSRSSVALFGFLSRRGLFIYFVFYCTVWRTKSPGDFLELFV